MSLATLVALANGDLENALVAATPGGIVAQEKAGQLEQAGKQTLPIECDRNAFEDLGFVFGNKIDNLFIEATFPAGWKKQPTDHDMWTDIIDDRGRIRAGIFYKAAFYDRKAHAHLTPRFSIRDDYTKPRCVYIEDKCGVVNERIGNLIEPDWDGDREKARITDNIIKRARETLEAWLTEHFPNWTDATAHWV